MSDEKTLLDQVREWEECTERLTRLKTLEMDMRKRLFGQLFTHTKGSQTFAVTPTLSIKGEAKENISVKEELVPAVLEALRAEGVVCANLFKYKPTLSMTEYNKLSPVHKTYVDYCCVRSPGSPSLEVKEKTDGD